MYQTKLGHVHLQVRDLDRSVDFYTRLLNLRVTERVGGHYALPPPSHEDGDVGKTQTVTPIDMENRRIRLPRLAKKFFPDHRAEVKVDLRGEVLQARYDPRTGPDRGRSATLVFQKSVAHLVRENERLAVTVGPTGLVCLR
ncbi:MAG: VOC family protein [Bacillota bacterium]